MTSLELTVEALKLCVEPETFERAYAQVSRGDIAPEASEKTISRQIYEALKELGAPPNNLGYQYCADAILLLVREPHLARRVTYGLYVRVGEMHGTTWQRVERSVRRAIESIFDRGDPRVLAKYFGNVVHPDKGKLTNAEFLSAVANHIKIVMGIL